jgi:predicted nucleotidyltransferase
MAMTEVVRSALRPLAPAYIALLERAIEATRQDERVRALWLGGSLARGQADAASDLDLLLAVQDEETAAFSASWRDFLSRIAPTVIARPVPFLPGVFYSVTASGERLDLVVEPVSRLPSTLFRSRLLVLDKDGLAARVPEPASAPGPSRERIAFLVEEFFRDHGMLHVSITRGDLLLGIEGIHVRHEAMERQADRAAARSARGASNRRKQSRGDGRGE